MSVSLRCARRGVAPVMKPHLMTNVASAYPYQELLSSFVEVDSIKRKFKGRLVGTVLNGYLCLRKLVVQRSKLIDETQDVLLDMLEDMTTGEDGLTSVLLLGTAQFPVFT